MLKFLEEGLEVQAGVMGPRTCDGANRPCGDISELTYTPQIGLFPICFSDCGWFSKRLREFPFHIAPAPTPDLLLNPRALGKKMEGSCGFHFWRCKQSWGPGLHVSCLWGQQESRVPEWPWGWRLPVQDFTHLRAHQSGTSGTGSQRGLWSQIAK